MKTKKEIAQISMLVITLLLSIFAVRADDPAAPVPVANDFWVRDQPGRISHACGGKEPLVLCMQGRKVVMQVQSDRTNGFSYTARFFSLRKEVEEMQALFVAGRESTPEVRVNDQPWKCGFPSSVAFDGMMTLTYPEAGGVVVTRTVYPSMTKALVIEEWQVRNTTGKQVVVTVAPARIGVLPAPGRRCEDGFSTTTTKCPTSASCPSAASRCWSPAAALLRNMRPWLLRV